MKQYFVCEYHRINQILAQLQNLLSLNQLESIEMLKTAIHFSDALILSRHSEMNRNNIICPFEGSDLAIRRRAIYFVINSTYNLFNTAFEQRRHYFKIEFLKRTESKNLPVWLRLDVSTKYCSAKDTPLAMSDPKFLKSGHPFLNIENFKRR